MSYSINVTINEVTQTVNVTEDNPTEQTVSIGVQEQLETIDISIHDLIGNNGLTEEEVIEIAEGATLSLQQQLLADAGQPGETVLAVGFTTSGKVMGVSLGAGNVVEVYASGDDFNNRNVLYREFMNFGEPIIFTGLSNGAIITSTEGFYGCSEQQDDVHHSPMPLLSYGLSFDFTFFYAFRNSDNYDPNGTGEIQGNQGWVHVVNGPLRNVIKITDGLGITVEGQQDIILNPWQYYRLYTSGNQEYVLQGTQPMMACHNANMDNNSFSSFYDSRLIMPLTNDGITWPRAGFISAPFNGTQVDFYVRDGVEGRINSGTGDGISPGTPIDFDAPIPIGTGVTDPDYEPDGATRVQAIGLVSAFSGADGAGLESTPLMPTSAMSQVVAQPFLIQDVGDGGNSSVSIASPYEGTARVYQWDNATSQAELAYTVPLTRNGVTVTTQKDQLHPAAGILANESVQGAVQLVGNLNPGLVVADVPISVISQSGAVNNTATFRSQNETTTTNIVHSSDETLMLGITPKSIEAEITEDADGRKRVRRIDNTGLETWELA